ASCFDTARASQPLCPAAFDLPNPRPANRTTTRLPRCVGWVIEPGFANLRGNLRRCAMRRSPIPLGNLRKQERSAVAGGLFDASTAISAWSDRGMSRIHLVMIVRDEARCLDRCLASA